MTIRVAAVQMPSTPGDIEQNLQAAEDLLRSIGRDCQLAVLPECAISGYDPDWFRDGAPGASPYPSRPFERMAALSAGLDMTIVLADLERVGEALYDTALVMTNGAVSSSHRKLVLTDREISAGLHYGQERSVPVACPGSIVVGAMVCYEYAFPEIALDLALAGANLLAVPAAVRSGFQHLIDVRTRARAQDNGCAVVMANAVGQGLGGGSVIVAPNGEVVAQGGGQQTEVLEADVEIGRQGNPTVSLPSAEEHLAVQRALVPRGG